MKIAETVLKAISALIAAAMSIIKFIDYMDKMKQKQAHGTA